MPGLENDVLVAKNVNFDFTAVPPHAGIITANGDLLIGSTANPNIQILKGRLVSSDASVTITYVAPNLDLSVAAVPPPAVVPPSFPHIQGMAFSKTGNTTTFHSWDGTQLTPAKPADLWIASPTNKSLLVNVKLTNNFQVIDAGGAGNMNGNSFGTSSGAWATDMPWYAYAVVNSAGTHGTIALSRVPNLTVAPAVGKCATRTSSVASSQGSMYFLDEVISGVPTAPTVANYAAQPCLLIGGLRAQKASLNNWVIQTLNATDGMGLYHENVGFTYPTNQNGATPVTNANTHFVETAGFPGYNGQNWFYSINRTGDIEFSAITADLTSNGANASDIVMTLPLRNQNFSNQIAGWFGHTGAPLPWIAPALNGGSLTASFKWESASSTFLTNADITGAPDAAAQFNITLHYIADIA